MLISSILKIMSSGTWRATKITGGVLKDSLEKLNSSLKKDRWSIASSANESGEVETSLQADYKFKTFSKTWAFLNVVAQNSCGLNHHPTILTTYNKVRLNVTTHDLGNTISDKDVEFANQLNQAFKSFLEQYKD